MTQATPDINVLLVDDLQENLVALEALIRQPGRRIHSARSGDEADRPGHDGQDAARDGANGSTGMHGPGRRMVQAFLRRASTATRMIRPLRSCW